MIDIKLFYRIILSMKILIILLFTFSCKPIRNSSEEYGRGPSTVPGEESPEFLAAKELIDSKCVSCHTSYHNSWKNSSEKSLIDSRYIVAGKPVESKLYQSLFNGGINTGSLMPKEDSEFSEEEKKVILDWIVSIKEEEAPPTTTPTTPTTKPGVVSSVEGTEEFKKFFNLVEQKCIWCHDTNDKYETSPSFRLTTAQQWLEATVDGAALIVDGDKDSSQFYDSIADGGNSRMPPEGLPKLTSSQVKIVEDFIASASVTTTTTSTSTTTTSTTEPGQTTSTTLANNARWIAARDVINQNCTGCHHATSNGFRTAGVNQLLNLTEAEFIDLENNDNFINQGNAAASIFYIRTKIAGKTPAGNTNMPRNGGSSDGSELSEADGKILADWINGL